MRGLALSLTTNLIWAMQVLYWPLLHPTPASELLAHRIVWSAACCGALVVALNALPWLGAKFLPVAAALAVVALVRLVREQRRAAVWLAVSLALSGVVYLVAHRLLWGGWTVYATGDHFVQTGEFSVIGVEPDYVGRSLRLVALLNVQIGIYVACGLAALVLLRRPRRVA